MANSTKRVGEEALVALYEQLNTAQREAVDTIEGPVLVAAGPGTGKTQVLALRIARILQETQMDPWNILCLTFTESGVAAMRQRLQKIIGETAYSVRIHTFHSFCQEVIREGPEIFVQGEEWEILSEVERVELFRELVDRLPAKSPLKPFNSPYLFLPAVVEAVRVLKQEDITPEKLAELLREMEGFQQEIGAKVEAWLGLTPKERKPAQCEELKEYLRRVATERNWPESLWSPVERMFVRYEERSGEEQGERQLSAGRTKLKNEVKKWYEDLIRQKTRQRDLQVLYAAYQVELKSRGRYDYEDMILTVVEEFKRNDRLLARYQEQFQYILVDEYQDTNGAQNEALRLLGGFAEAPNIFVVGDDKQSIYRFQGASLENIRFFYELYQRDIKVITLSDNYRSQPAVLAAAGEVIDHNLASAKQYIPGLRGELTAQGGRKEQALKVISLPTAEAELFWLGKQIKSLLEAGVAPSEVAVLVRYHREARVVYEALEQEDLPVQLRAGEPLLKQPEVRQWLEVLNYVVGKASDDKLAKVLLAAWSKIEPVEALKVIQAAGRQRKSLWEEVVRSEEKEVREMAGKLARWKQLAGEESAPRLLQVMLEEAGYWQWVLGKSGELKRLRSVSALVEEARRFGRRKARGAEQWLKELELMEAHNLSPVVPPLTTTSEKVQILTAHKAKGLEFEQVFIPRLVDGRWGNVRARGKLKLPPGVLPRDVVSAGENNEDERRLFYVALTRAKQGLYLSYARQNEEGREQVPAVFISELPVEGVEREELVEKEEEARERLLKAARLPAQMPTEQALKEWLTGRLENYVMSVTHLNNYLQCPRLFYMRNLVQLPAATTPAAALGTAVHATLRDWLQEYQEEGRLLKPEWLKSKLAQYLEREDLAQIDYRASLELGQEALVSYAAKYEMGKMGELKLEYDFRGHGVRVEGVELTGKLDKVEVVKAVAREVRVVDYKTGNPDNARSKLRPGGNYWRQMVFYKLLTQLSPRFNYEMTEGVVEFIQPSKKKGQLVTERIEVSRSDVEELKKVIKQTSEEIQALKFLKVGSGCGRSDCEGCNFGV
jgi:DNA helicase-2/ATP-dependent DNA helicase PcrA